MIGAFFSILLSLSGLYFLASNGDIIPFIACQIAALAWYIIGYFYHKFDVLSGNIKGGKIK